VIGVLVLEEKDEAIDWWLKSQDAVLEVYDFFSSNTFDPEFSKHGIDIDWF
jgi:hypothetical protein